MSVVLTTDVKEDEGYAVVHIAGNLDASTAPDFEAALMPLAQNEALGKVILDGGEIRFMASAGLRVLIGAVKVMKPRKAALYLAGASDEVVSVLKMTGFLALMEVRPSIGDCLA